MLRARFWDLLVGALKGFYRHSVLHDETHGGRNVVVGRKTGFGRFLQRGVLFLLVLPMHAEANIQHLGSVGGKGARTDAIQLSVPCENTLLCSNLPPEVYVNRKPPKVTRRGARWAAPL
jgi:hypothetical protein